MFNLGVPHVCLLLANVGSRSGHPQFLNWKEKARHERLGHTPRWPRERCTIPLFFGNFLLKLILLT